jgi:hypothetical protein
MLSGVGLSRHQEELYRRVLARPGQTLAGLLEGDGGRPAGQARADLDRLVELGLIAPTSGDPVRYLAAAPDAAIKRLVNGRIDAARLAEREIDGLMNAFWHGRRSPDGQVTAELAGLVEVVDGARAVTARLVQLYGSSRCSIRAFETPVPVDGARPEASGNQSGWPGSVARRVIYPRAGLEMPGRYEAIATRMATGEQVRVHPDVPARLTLFDDVAAGIDVSPDLDRTRILIVHRSRLLECLSALFESYWAAALPIDPSTDGQLPAGMPELNVTIGTLLSTGMTDEAIGHALGISPSTVYRRVHEIMIALGASSRFQAGFLLAQRRSTAPDQAAHPPVPQQRNGTDPPDRRGSPTPAGTARRNGSVAQAPT